MEEPQFQTLLEQVRELHDLADELSRSTARIHDNVRARLYWRPDPPTLPADQQRIADEVVDVLQDRRLSSRQARQLERAFLGGGKGAHSE